MATKTKKDLERENDGLRGEIKRLVELARKALGAREANHKHSAIGLAREYLEKIVEGKG